MSCRAALAVYERNHGERHIPGAHHPSHMGHFVCRLTRDDTPPLQDTDVRIRCVHERQAFRLHYAI